MKLQNLKQVDMQELSEGRVSGESGCGGWWSEEREVRTCERSGSSAGRMDECKVMQANGGGGHHGLSRGMLP